MALPPTMLLRVNLIIVFSEYISSSSNSFCLSNVAKVSRSLSRCGNFKVQKGKGKTDHHVLRLIDKY